MSIPPAAMMAMATELAVLLYSWPAAPLGCCASGVFVAEGRGEIGPGLEGVDVVDGESADTVPAVVAVANGLAIVAVAPVGTDEGEGSAES